MVNESAVFTLVQRIAAIDAAQKEYVAARVASWKTRGFMELAAASERLEKAREAYRLLWWKDIAEKDKGAKKRLSASTARTAFP